MNTTYCEVGNNFRFVFDSTFENRVLRRVFGPKRDEVTGELIKLHNEELNDL
jgi:hypothetical protein